MDLEHQPAVIGTCVHCHLPLYASAPIAKGSPTSSQVLELAHVGCAVDAHRVR